MKQTIALEDLDQIDTESDFDWYVENLELNASGWSNDRMNGKYDC